MPDMTAAGADMCVCPDKAGKCKPPSGENPCFSVIITLSSF
jgi:hypothetical protein